MDFGYTEEQQQLRKTIREFCEAEIKPHVMEWDESQEFPLHVFKELGKLGVLGAVFPEELGGSGYRYVDYSIVMEELARVDPSVALSAAAHISLCTNHIYLAGNEEQKRRYIPKLASGEWIGSWALTEPESGSDAGGTHTRAVFESGNWVINGSKTFTTNGQVADVCVVMAVTDRAASSHGISAFLLEKGTPGFRPGKKENKLGMRCSPTNEMILTDCRVPASQLCGKQGEGFVDALRILDGGRISIAALAVGLAQGAYVAALRYSIQR
jgi:alkylation response protein AidB-like acyl-CoA dehydrogenase